MTRFKCRCNSGRGVDDSPAGRVVRRVVDRRLSWQNARLPRSRRTRECFVMLRGIYSRVQKSALWRVGRGPIARAYAQTRCNACA